MIASAIMALAAVVMLPGIAHALTFDWRGLNSGHAGADGVTYGLPANWNFNAVPSAFDDARFQSDGSDWGTIQIGAGFSVQELDVNNVVDLDLAGTFITGETRVGSAPGVATLRILSGMFDPLALVVGKTAGADATAVISGPLAQADLAAEIGMGAGDGHLIVEQGAQCTGFVMLASGTGSAAMTVDGAGTYCDLVNGSATGADIVVSNGAVVDVDACGLNASSNLYVQDPGSQWNITVNKLTGLGAIVTVQSGGAFSTQDALLQGSTAVFVDGDGSSWEASDRVDLQDAHLEIVDGGYVQTPRTELTGVSQATIDGANSLWHITGLLTHFGQTITVSGGGQIMTDQTTSASGGSILLLDSGSEWNATGTMSLSDIALTISGGASLNYSSALSLHSTDILLNGAGSSITGSGGVTLTSGSIEARDGTTMQTGGLTLVGSNPRDIALEGAQWHAMGNVTVPDQLSVDGTSSFICDGTVRLPGGSADLANAGFVQAESLSVGCWINDGHGYGSTGTLRLNGWSFTDCQTLGALPGTVQLGHSGGRGQGVKRVTSAGMQPPVFSTNELVVGYDAVGTMVVTGEVETAGSGTLGDQAAGLGDVRSSSNWDSGLDLVVGRFGQGYFHGHDFSTTTIDRDLLIAEEVGSHGEFLLNNGTLYVGGSAYVGGGRSMSGGTGLLQHMHPGAQTTIVDTLCIWDGGRVTVGTGTLTASRIYVKPGGKLTGRGTINAEVVNLGGDVYIDSLDSTVPGSVSINPNFRQFAGTLHAAIASLAQHDSLIVADTLQLGGMLHITADSSYVAAPGNEFVIASASTVLGTFAAVTGSTLPAGLSWDVVVDGSNVKVVVSGTPANTPIDSPRRLHLAQNAPNPFTRSTRIEFALPARSDTRLTVYDLGGRRVATLIDRSLEPGHHAVEWSGLAADGRRVPAGIYYYSLRVGTREIVKRMALLP